MGELGEFLFGDDDDPAEPAASAVTPSATPPAAPPGGPAPVSSSGGTVMPTGNPALDALMEAGDKATKKDNETPKQVKLAVAGFTAMMKETFGVDVTVTVAGIELDEAKSNGTGNGAQDKAAKDYAKVKELVKVETPADELIRIMAEPPHGLDEATARALAMKAFEEKENPWQS